MSPATRRQQMRLHHRRSTSTDEVGPPSVRFDDPMRVPIGEVMTRNLVVVFDDFSVETLEEVLLDRALSGVPVVDDDGKLVGFVGMTDIVRDLHERGDTSETSKDDSLVWGFHEEAEPRIVAQLMTEVALELPESCPLAKAVELMTTQHIHRVPVVSEEGELVGIVTAGDIVRFLARVGRTASGPAETADAGPDARAEAEREHRAEADRLVSLGFLAGGLAHQINNALTPMRLGLGRLTSFELSRRPLSAERLHRIELLQDVREGVERIERIIRELRVFSHTDDGTSRAVDLSELLDTAIGLAAHEIRHRAQLICDHQPVPAVRARPAELRQVLVNLLVNAAQAIPVGEAHINEIRVTSRTDEHGRAVIEIKDTGTGIPADVLSRIFEPFRTGRSERVGLGLGLAVARDVVWACGGEITIDSVVGQGTMVRVALPPCAAIDLPVVAGAQQTSHEQEADVRHRILIVDDDRPVAAAIALELAAHDVVVAESGREALKILQMDKDFDVILCDLMMPEVTGMDVYEALRLIDPSLLGRIVLMTGGAFTARAGKFLSEVHAPLIEKPFEPGQLHAVVNAIEHRRVQFASVDQEPEDVHLKAIDPDAEDIPWRPYDRAPGKGV